jgi:hypothetical protein
VQQPEAKLKQKLIHGFIAASRGEGWYTYLTPSMFQKQGLPDLVFSWPGGDGGIWVEAKAGNNPVSELQRRVFSKMARTGVDIRIIRWTADTLDASGKFRVANLSRWTADGDEQGTKAWSWSKFEQPLFWTSMFAIGQAA